jgi:hypothetical protein
MAFKFEKIPEEEYCRFNDLAEHRQSMIKSKLNWAVDRERDAYCVHCISREPPHRPDRLPGEIPFSYYLLNHKGVYFSLETKRKLISKGERFNSKDYYRLYDTILFLDDSHADAAQQYVNLAIEGVKCYIFGDFYWRANNSQIKSTLESVEITIDKIKYRTDKNRTSLEFRFLW